MDKERIYSRLISEMEDIVDRGCGDLVEFDTPEGYTVHAEILVSDQRTVSRGGYDCEPSVDGDVYAEVALLEVRDEYDELLLRETNILNHKFTY